MAKTAPSGAMASPARSQMSSILATGLQPVTGLLHGASGTPARVSSLPTSLGASRCKSFFARESQEYPGLHSFGRPSGGRAGAGLQEYAQPLPTPLNCESGGMSSSQQANSAGTPSTNWTRHPGEFELAALVRPPPRC